jgi:hypothetical protein
VVVSRIRKTETPVILLLQEMRRCGKGKVDQTGKFWEFTVSFMHVTLGVSSPKVQKIDKKRNF